MSAITLILLSLIFWISYLDHDFGTLSDIGTGFLPKILAILLLFLSVISLLVNGRGTDTTTITVLPLVIPGIVLIFAVVSWTAGIFWATSVATVLGAILWKQKKLTKLMILTVSMICLVYIIFEILLKF